MPIKSLTLLRLYAARPEYLFFRQKVAFSKLTEEYREFVYRTLSPVLFDGAELMQPPLYAKLKLNLLIIFYKTGRGGIQTARIFTHNEKPLEKYSSPSTNRMIT
jgi:hypothetical protein